MNYVLTIPHAKKCIKMLSRNKAAKGALLCLFTSVAWGAMFPVMGSALQKMDAFYLSVYRYSIMSVLLCAVLFLFEGRRSFRLDGKGKALWFYGTMAVAGYNLLVFWAQHRMGVSGTILASIMESMMPMITVPILWIGKRERPAAFTLLCVAVAFVGVLAVVTKGDFRSFLLSGDSLLATVVMFLGVVGWVVYTIGAERFGDWSPLRYTALSCLLGTVSADLIVFAATGFGYLRPPGLGALYAVRWELGYTVLVSGVAALLSWNAGVKLLKPINGMLFVNFVPVVTFLIAVLQGYRMTFYDAVGSALIIGALLLNNLFQRKLGGLPLQPAARERTAGK